jgi:hypothetical protein
MDDHVSPCSLSLGHALRRGTWLCLAVPATWGEHMSVTGRPYDQDEDGEEWCQGHLCEWCHEREAERQHLVFGFGRLYLCENCAMMLLSSIMDNG